MLLSHKISGLVLLSGLSIACCRAQQPGPPPGGGPPPPPPTRGSFPEEYGHFPKRTPGPPPPGGSPDTPGTVSTMRGGLQVGPPGRWWDDKNFAMDLGLRPEQQRRMDAIFEANRGTILQRYQAYLQAQNSLESLARSNVLDEPTLMAEIAHVGRARVELEQSNTHMLIEILRVMNEAQRARLSSHR